MRAYWKGPYIDLEILKMYNSSKQLNSSLLTRQTVNTEKNKNLKDLKTKSRQSTILPFLENKPIKIYNGQKYFLLKPTINHIGHKFGSFIFTKKKCTFGSKKKTTNKK